MRLPYVLKIFLVMTLVSLINLNFVSASTIDSLNKILSNTDTILTPDEILQSEELSNEIEEYLISEVGENYVDKFSLNKVSADNAKKIKKTLATKKYVDGNEEIIYPNYIGGIYINKNDELVIQVVKDKVPAKKDENYSLYNQTILQNQNFIIEYVDNSYNDMIQIIKQIDNYYSTNNSIGKNLTMINGKIKLENKYNYGNVSEFYIDEINNRVVVKLSNYSDEEVNKFKNEIVDSTMITFEKEEKLSNYLFPGQIVALEGGCSMGYRARQAFVGNVGFVTAGHCVISDGIYYPHVGTVASWQNSGNIDAAFIVTESNNILTNSLYGVTTALGSTPSLSTNVLDATTGERVSKLGASSGYTTGIVTSTNWNGTIAGVSHTSLVDTSVYAKEGDSGGIVFGASNYYTAGIVNGGPIGGGNLIYTPASRINNKFVISRY